LYTNLCQKGFHLQPCLSGSFIIRERSAHRSITAHIFGNIGAIEAARQAHGRVLSAGTASAAR
jgi:hypothetical protein